jgi:chromosome segregation ATPase
LNKSELAEEQLQALIDLRKMTHTQKDQIKELQKDLDSYCKEVGALRDNIERLIQQNKELLRKNNSLQVRLINFMTYYSFMKRLFIETGSNSIT